MHDVEIHQILEEADCLYSGEQIESALDTLSESITSDLAGSNPLVLCVMNGALIPAGYLVTRLKFPLEIDSE